METDANQEIAQLKATLSAIRTINDGIIAGIGTSMPTTVVALQMANSLIDECLKLVNIQGGTIIS